MLDTCNRFKTMKDCNDPNSFLWIRESDIGPDLNVSLHFPNKQVVSENIWECVPEHEELNCLVTGFTISKEVHTRCNSESKFRRRGCSKAFRRSN